MGRFTTFHKYKTATPTTSGFTAADLTRAKEAVISAATLQACGSLDGLTFMNNNQAPSGSDVLWNYGPCSDSPLAFMLTWP